MTKEVPLTKGKVALVDDDDFERVRHYKWHAHASRNGVWYADGRPHGKPVSMHAFILEVAGPLLIDHRNHNGLDNRRSNLRLVTAAQNSINRRKLSVFKGGEPASQFKGVHFRSDKKKRKRWYAAIKFTDQETGTKRQRHLGYFSREEDAARAYDKAARAIFGEHAYLNFPEKHEEQE